MTSLGSHFSALPEAPYPKSTTASDSLTHFLSGSTTSFLMQIVSLVGSFGKL